MTDNATDRHVEQVEAERDQYAAAIRHLILTVRHTAHVWVTTQPEMIRTADAASALARFASEGTERLDLRDDLWQRIVGAYYVRFENDGHPEDSQAAADEAMAIVQPEIDRLNARIEDWKTAAGAGMRLTDELRAERDALAVGVPLVCSDERHKVKALALELARERIRALHSPVTHLSQVWCGECSVRRRTGPTTEEWVAYIPHPCRTIQALDGEES